MSLRGEINELSYCLGFVDKFSNFFQNFYKKERRIAYIDLNP